MEVGIGLLIFFGLLFLGMPVYAALFVGSLVTVFLIGEPLIFFPSIHFFALNNFLLLAVPFFVLAGDLMTAGGMSERLVDLAHSLVGRIRGGLAHVTVVTTLFFGTLTGSCFAAVAAIGTTMIPRMESYGIDRRYSTALVICSAFLGYMIPPSIGGIIYAYIANVSVAAMFMATAIPGVLVALGYMVVNFFVVPRLTRPVTSAKGTAVVPAVRLRDVPRAGFFAFPALLTPIIILGGIYGGIFTPTEAASVACIWALLAGFLIYRKLNLRGTSEAFSRAAITTCVIFAILIFAVPVTRLFIREGMATAMTTFMLDISDNPYVILGMVNIFLLLMGMILEGLAILIMIVPLLLPVLAAAGVNPIHVGVIMLLNLGIGTQSPPFGTCLFLGCQVGDVAYHEVLRHVVRFIILVGIPVLALTTFIPALSLWLPALVVGPEMVYGLR